MSNVFKNPLVLSEVVVGSIIDTRALVLYEQPENIDFDNIVRTVDEETGEVKEESIFSLVDRRQLKELFTGFDVPYVSKINGMNIYGISYVKADVDITSDICDHPVETGSVITDTAIIQPISIKVQIALPTAFKTRIYNEMIKYYQTKKYIMVQTPVAMYRNMIIESMPFALENETIDRPVIELSLRQIQEVEVQYIKTENPVVKSPKSAEDTDTKDLGRKVGSVVGEMYGG